MKLILLFGFLFLQACVSVQRASEIDRNDHLRTEANLNSDIHSMTSPASGLRSAQQGTNSCTACVH